MKSNCKNCKFIIKNDGSFYCGKDMTRHGNGRFNDKILDINYGLCTDHIKKTEVKTK